MIALILGLTIPLAWLAAGFGLAVRELPKLWREAYAKWPGNDFYMSDRRSYVKGWFAAAILGWPFLLLILIPGNKMGDLIDSRDPGLPERRRKEAAKRLAELEKEAGLGELHPGSWTDERQAR